MKLFRFGRVSADVVSCSCEDLEVANPTKLSSASISALILPCLIDDIQAVIKEIAFESNKSLSYCTELGMRLPQVSDSPMETALRINHTRDSACGANIRDSRRIQARNLYTG